MTADTTTAVIRVPKVTTRLPGRVADPAAGGTGGFRGEIAEVAVRS